MNVTFAKKVQILQSVRGKSNEYEYSGDFKFELFSDVANTRKSNLTFLALADNFKQH